MADIASLFGLTPEGLSQQRYQQDLKQGYELAQLDPGAAARATLQSGVGQLGRGVAGLLGVQDPQMQLMTARQQIFSQVDQSNPQSYVEAAKQLQSIGDTQGAFTMADYARKAESEIAQAKARMAQANRERQQAIPAKVLESEYEGSLKSAIRSIEALPEKTPEQEAKLQNFKDTLAAMTRTKDQAANIKTVGVAAGSKKPVFLDVNSDQQFTYEIGEDGKQVRKPYVGQVDRTTSNVTATATTKGEESFIVELAKDDAKELSNARAKRAAAIDELGSLEKLQQLNQKDLISGSFATGRVGVLNLFNTLGMTSGKDANKLASSEEYTKVTGDLLLDKIKKLGTQPSSTDREFIAKILPQLENSAIARQELINYLAKRANEVVSDVTRMDTYARTNKGLGGFVPRVPLIGQTPTVSTMSTEQLMRIATGKQP